MKITTWNVNGIRAVLAKRCFDWVREEAPDVLCLQEVKARPEQIVEADLLPFNGYRAIWNPAQRPGYSGVVTFTRHPPQETLLGIGVGEFDSEGRVVANRFDGFWLFNIYFPNGQRDAGRLDFKLRFYAELLNLCDRLHAAGDHVIITGDFNTAHREIDLRNPKQNVNNSGFMPIEREWIDIYLQHGFVDAFRQLYPDRVQYTWWTYISNARQRNVGWRLDYYLVSASLMPSIRDVVIHDNIIGSDHCPVSLLIGQ